MHLADRDCPCNHGIAKAELPTLVDQTVYVDACTTWGVGLNIAYDTNGRGTGTQLSIGQARAVAAALTAAADAINQAVNRTGRNHRDDD